MVLKEMEQKRDVSEIRSLTSQVNIGLNIVASIFTLFVVGFFIAKLLEYNTLTVHLL
jgi:hypothetical protein